MPRTCARIVVLASLAALCAGCAKPTTTPVPSPVAEATEPAALYGGGGAGAVVASGVVVPAKQARLGAAAAARVESVEVDVGDPVEEEQVLIYLEGRDEMRAAVAAAELELISAQQALNALDEQAWQVTAQAQLELANARDALRIAEYRWRVQQKGYRASTDVVDEAEANLVLAEEEVRQAEKDYAQFSGRAEDDPARALALSNLAEARQQRDSVSRNLNWYRGQPTELQQAILDAEVASAQARVALAESVWVRVKDGGDPQAKELAEARLTNAKAQLEAAKGRLEGCALRSPLDGAVAEVLVNPGEAVLPGQALVTVGDLSHLVVETTDLSERDIDLVVVGQRSTVSIEGLGLSVEGTVTQISPIPNTLGGDVVYKVRMELDEQPAGLRWGMSVEVEILTE